MRLCTGYGGAVLFGHVDNVHDQHGFFGRVALCDKGGYAGCSSVHAR